MSAVYPDLTFPPINLWSMPVQHINQLINEVIKKEGGYVNHPDDHGKATKYGITQATLSGFRGHACSAADVKALSKAAAAVIYRHQYYIKPGFDKLPEALQPVIFDMGVNCGPGRAVKLLQATLHAAGYNPGPEDGVLGGKTQLAARKAYDALGPALINNLVARRCAYYRALVEADASQQVFLNGWLARAESFRLA
jgi:lysozyme family protein